ncbi:MAG: S1 family peptidase [Pseudobdellovibrionaceae bacterium]
MLKLKVLKNIAKWISSILLLWLFSACSQQTQKSKNHPIMASQNGIIGGQIVTDKSPFAKSVVSIIYYNFDDNSNPVSAGACTGVLIGKDTVLTAAHCLKEDKTYYVIFSNNCIIKIKDFNENTEGPNSRFVKYKIMHPDYSSTEDSSQYGDIGFVKFSGRLPQGYKPVSLAPTDSPVESDDFVQIYGFGVTAAFNNDEENKEAAPMPTTLRTARLQILDHQYSDSEFSIDQSHGSGACLGDSGGPVFIKRNNLLYLYGILSRTKSDCTEHTVATNILYYKEWLVESGAIQR